VPTIGAVVVPRRNGKHATGSSRSDFIMTERRTVTIGGVFTLTDDNYGYWVGHMPVPSWIGLTHASDATASVEIEIQEDREDTGPTPTQRRACEWFLANESLTVESVLDAIATAYPRLQLLYGGGAAIPSMPPLRDRNDLRPLIDLRMLYFHDVDGGELPYIGYVFGCKWDEEHGLGVLMHGLRPVEVEGADMAILKWVALRDADRRP
jgi:hypothetical protein